MRNAQQRGALCAHGELRNCLYQRQFRARRRHTTLVPPRGAPQGRWEFSPPSPREVPRRGGGSNSLSLCSLAAQPAPSQREPRGRREFLPSLCKGGWRSGAATEGLSCYQFVAKGVLL